jgi:pyruvate ferredoxin oxidoreductase beta subunit
MKDLYEKAEKAFYTPGGAFLNVLAPCPRGWQYPTENLMEINKLALETCYWPMYEVIDGKYTINYIPKNKLPITEFLRPQGRFKHLFTPGHEKLIEQIQAGIDARWARLLHMAEMK